MKRPSWFLWLSAAALCAALGALGARAFWSGEATREQVIREIQNDVGRWADPAWQQKAREKVAAVGLEMILKDAAGREIYRTSPDSPPTEEPPVGKPISIWINHVDDGGRVAGTATFWAMHR